MAAIRMFNYWSHRKPVATFLAAKKTEIFFDSSTANSVLSYGNSNDLLASGGALPDNRIGSVTGLFVWFINGGSEWTQAMSKLCHQLINISVIRLYVGGAEVQRGPAWAFCRPPEWSFSDGGGTGGTGFTQNGGYLLQTAIHPYQSQQTLRVEWELVYAPTADCTTIAPAVTIQTLDSRQVGA